MKNNTFLIVRWLNVLVFMAMVAINALAVILPINGVTPGQVSDMYPSLFTPAAITFSIWSLIYFLLFLFAFYQAGLFTNDSLNSYDAAKRIGWLFIVSSLLNVAWIFCWHYDLILLALVCMFGILISLAMAFSRITSEPLSAQESIFVKLPFAVYFGWITVAVIAAAAACMIVLLIELKYSSLKKP